MITADVEVLGDPENRHRYENLKFKELPRIGEWVEIDEGGWEVKMIIHLPKDERVIVRVR